MSHQDWKGPGWYHCWSEANGYLGTNMKRVDLDLCPEYQYRPAEVPKPPEPRLKPCPNPECRGEDIRVDGILVACSNCYMEGPYVKEGRNETEAVRLWNLLPREGDCKCGEQ
jgi:hypothetical protein